MTTVTPTPVTPATVIPTTNVLERFSAPDRTTERPDRPGMVRAELYKLMHHRTPWMILLGLTLLTVVAPIYYLFRPPADAADYIAATMAVLGVATALLAPVFGAWIMGSEYRQSTLKRVVALEGRRNGLLMTKGLMALALGVVGILFAAGAGVGASALASQVHGQTLVVGELSRTIAATVFVGLVVISIAYLASVIFRSDAYAMIGTIGLMSVFGQLLGLIPRIGDYMPPVAMTTISEWIATPGLTFEDGLLGKAFLSLGLTLGVAAIAARQLFAVRDL